MYSVYSVVTTPTQNKISVYSAYSVVTTPTQNKNFRVFRVFSGYNTNPKQKFRVLSCFFVVNSPSETETKTRPRSRITISMRTTLPPILRLRHFRSPPPGQCYLRTPRRSSDLAIFGCQLNCSDPHAEVAKLIDSSSPSNRNGFVVSCGLHKARSRKQILLSHRMAVENRRLAHPMVVRQVHGQFRFAVIATGVVTSPRAG